MSRFFFIIFYYYWDKENFSLCKGFYYIEVCYIEFTLYTTVATGSFDLEKYVSQ